MKKMNKFSKKAAEFEAWGELLEYATQQRNYTMETKTDEEGNPVTDKDGNEIMIPPVEDRYSYSRYVGWCEVVKALETMKI